MAKILTIYDRRRRPFSLAEMSYIRWLKISEALARLGHEVHIGTNEPGRFFSSKKHPVHMMSNLIRLPLGEIDVMKYDVIKTLFHMGFESLDSMGGLNHPFIISKLGSVVGSADTPGIPFFGKRRERLFATQKKISRVAKYITLLTPAAMQLWQALFPWNPNVLMVPGAADKTIPSRNANPYPNSSRKTCIFAGNIYIKQVQAEANRILCEKLNALGKFLLDRGIQLYMIGTGDVRRLNPDWICYLGAVPYDFTWDYFHYADVGIVVNPGTFLHNNESSKIYHYLRAGLPVVMEQGFPNEFIIAESGLGYVSENGNMLLMADLVEAAIRKVDWNRKKAVEYILQNHTWDRRAEIYDRLIREHFA